MIAQIQSGLLIFVYYKLDPNYSLAKLRSFRGARIITCLLVITCYQIKILGIFIQWVNELSSEKQIAITTLLIDMSLRSLIVNILTDIFNHLQNCLELRIFGTF